MVLGMGTSMTFGFGLLLAIINIAISGVLLWLSAAKFFKVGADWKRPYVIAVIVGVVAWLLGLIPWAGSILAFIVSILLGLWLIKTKYDLDWKKTALVWLVWFVLALIAGAILAAIFAPLFIGAAVAGAGSALLG